MSLLNVLYLSLFNGVNNLLFSVVIDYITTSLNNNNINYKNILKISKGY
jgi:hypothetical protein